MDIAIVIKEDMDDRTREKFIIWSADMDLRYDRVFSIVDIQEKNLKNGEVYFRFIRMCRRRGLFFGRQLKGTGRLSDGKSQ